MYERKRTWGLRIHSAIIEGLGKGLRVNELQRFVSLTEEIKRLWLGTFDNAVDATFAYNEAARVMYGAYARLNFPKFVSTIFGPTLVEFEVLLMALLPCPVQVSLLPYLV